MFQCEMCEPVVNAKQNGRVVKHKHQSHAHGVMTVLETRRKEYVNARGYVSYGYETVREAMLCPEHALELTYEKVRAA